MLKFVGEKKYVDNIKKLLTPPSSSPVSTEPAKATHTSSEAQLSHSDVAIAVGEEDSASGDDSVQPVWLSANKISLLDEDRRIIATGEKLNDKHINFAQSLLKKQFKDIQGLISTLLLISRGPGHTIASNGLQIIHTRDSHWIVATTIGCTNEVLVFDTLYSTVDKPTIELIRRTFAIWSTAAQDGESQEA